MTECKEYKNQIFPYLDGDLKKRDAEELEGHISGCSECAAELERDKKTLNLIKSAFYTPKKSVLKSVMAAIEAERRRKSVVRYGSTAAACIVGVALIGTFTFMSVFNGAKSESMKDEAAPEMSIAATAESTAAAAETAAGEGTDADSDEAEVPMMLSFWGGMADEEAAPEADEASPEEEAAPPANNAAPEEEAVPVEEAVPAALDPTLKSATVSPANGDIDGTIEFYTNIYAPDYAGTVRAVITGYEQPDFECEQISDGDNFTVFVREYDADTAAKYSDALIGSESETATQMLYVMLK